RVPLDDQDRAPNLRDLVPRQFLILGRVVAFRVGQDRSRILGSESITLLGTLLVKDPGEEDAGRLLWHDGGEVGFGRRGERQVAPPAATDDDDTVPVDVREPPEVLDRRECVLHGHPRLGVHVPAPIRDYGNDVSRREKPGGEGAERNRADPRGRYSLQAAVNQYNDRERTVPRRLP